MSTARERTREAQGKPAKVGWSAFKVTVGGEDVIVDQNTFSGKERTIAKRALASLGYEPDGEDRTYAAIWVVMRRADEKLTFDAFLESINVIDYMSSETVADDEDDSPEV